MASAAQATVVTGAAGFIGWKVVELLLGGGHTVVGIDNLNDAYDVRLKQWRLAQLEGRDGFQFHRLDITDRDALASLFAELTQSPVTKDQSPTTNHQPPITAVINLAARAGVRQSVENPWIYYETNVTGTLNLLELCRKHGIGKFVLASTSSVYGENERPFREDQPTDRPLSPYAASKKAAETLCYTYHRLYGLDVSVLRYFTVYGPAGRPDMSVFRFIQWIAEGQPLQLYGDGSQQRDFTYVDDIARGTIAALISTGYEVFNLGSDRPVTLHALIERIEASVDQSACIVQHPRQPADVMATWADISKAQQQLDWSPATSLEHGLQTAVDWYRRHRDWARDVRL